jgi:hypothetical protein
MDPLLFSLSPLIFMKSKPFELETDVSSSSHTAQPPRGIPCAFIEHISLIFAFSNREPWNPGNGAPMEVPILKTASTNKICVYKYYETQPLGPNSDRLCYKYDVPELYADLEEYQDEQSHSLSQNDTWISSPREEDHIDTLIEDLQMSDPEAERALDPISENAIPKHILRLADAGMRSIFCRGETRKATSVHLSNQATGFKLSDISPALFIPGYVQVGFLNFPSFNAAIWKRTRVTVIRQFLTITVFLKPSPILQP